MLEKELSTEEYEQDDREIIKASDINENGITVKFAENAELQERESQFPGSDYYYSIELEKLMNGEEIPAVLNFSGKRLKRLIEDNIEQLKGETVEISAIGQDVERRYYIKPVE